MSMGWAKSLKEPLRTGLPCWQMHQVAKSAQTVITLNGTESAMLLMGKCNKHSFNLVFPWPSWTLSSHDHLFNSLNRTGWLRHDLMNKSFLRQLTEINFYLLIFSFWHSLPACKNPSISEWCAKKSKWDLGSRNPVEWKSMCRKCTSSLRTLEV